MKVSPLDETAENDVLAGNVVKLLVLAILEALNPSKIRKRTDSRVQNLDENLDEDENDGISDGMPQQSSVTEYRQQQLFQFFEDE